MVNAMLHLELGSGMVLGVPIPPQHAAEGQEVEAAIQQALHEADAKSIAGSEVRRLLRFNAPAMRMFVRVATRIVRAAGTGHTAWLQRIACADLGRVPDGAQGQPGQSSLRGTAWSLRGSKKC
jgi:hypothetical protein